MSPSKILDTHIHLWPAESCVSTAHSWMTPGHFLAKPHVLSTYLSASNDPRVKGVIYVETDRSISSVPPAHTNSGRSARDEAMISRVLMQSWAHEPLEEIRFLRGIVESGGKEGEMLKGCVLYAPMQLPEHMFNTYLAIAEEAAGPELWKRVVGFRYLLQAKEEGVVEKLVSSEQWIANLVTLGSGRAGRGWTFDVGIDINRDGEGVLQDVAGMIAEVRKRGSNVRFILNHLCKPPLSDPAPSQAWISALLSFKSDSNIYMKLSGALNEFSSPTPDSVPAMLDTLRPYLNTVFDCFPDRVMFGSDWPVCNVGGPKGEEGNWGFWRDVVEACMEDRGMRPEEREGVWSGAGESAYGVQI
ncbi:hypothetical protein DE146DRAFT_143708 [Phaeosphaeria sp. MPI-PUGE-AT-0046c]|nr:hypothetical protein DE146DRAFT_143708 [Phaeosphaeria sp. MPI-PUGE-AT-0046c]